MDTVVAFNAELTGLYESKPPISKAKMTSITRSAMKASKFYKHVVQSVEKFILKCKQEYKIPGLYVIDSIVRQSRHQFGTEKDVFAPRFARNMQTTFANLFQCSPDDKSKIIRVLNLWQKNSVFAPEVIQPLFDLANPKHPIYQNQNANQDGTNISNGILSSMAQDSPSNNVMDDGHTMSSDLSGSLMPSASQLDASTIRQLQQLQHFLILQTSSEPVPSTSSTGVGDSIKFNKKLLDYDYGDDDDDDKGQSPRQSQQQLQAAALDNSNISQLLNDPNVLRQLQNLQKLKQQEEKQSKLAEMRMQEEAFEKHLASVLKKLPFANECDLSRQDRNDPIFSMQNSANLNTLLHQQQQQSSSMGMIGSNAGDSNRQHDPEVELVSDDGKVEIINLDGNSRSPSIDRDRYKRRRSRSRSRDRGSRDRRRRSRSRSPRGRRRMTSRDRERERGKEKDRERKRKGLPEIRREMLSVCSTTLWIGHLSKLVQQEELSDTFGKYGDIVTIDMIIPRGCAFIAMHRRQDAYKAIDALKNHKLGGRAITISWAPGKGVKSKEWKEYWDLETGVSYIPWSKLDDSTDFEGLEDGGMIDEESAPTWLTEKLKAELQKKEQRKNAVDIPQMPNMAMFGIPGAPLDTSQPPPNALPPLMASAPPMVPPFAMPPRFMGPMGMPMPHNLSMPLGVPPPMNGQMMMPGGMVPGMPMMDKNMAQPGNAAPFIGYFPPIPHMPPIPQNTGAPVAMSNSSNDDHMDIEMEDESKPAPAIAANNQPNLLNQINMFNRPPPQIFPQAMPTGIFLDGDTFGESEGRDDRGNSRDRNSIDRERNDFRGRGRERDAQGRGSRGDNRRSGDFSNERNPRWQEERNRSRDNEFNRAGGKNNNRDRAGGDRRSHDRDKTLQDRLRDLAGAANAAAGEFVPVAARGGNGGPWPPGALQQPNFASNPMDLGNRKNFGMGGPPPALEDLEIPVPIEAMRSNLGGKGRFKNDFNRSGGEFDRRGGGPQGRDFFGGNRFGPPGINGPMGGRGGNFGPRNNSPMFGGAMWNRNAGAQPDRFFERDGAGGSGGNNRDTPEGGQGGFGRRNNGQNTENRRGGRPNKGRGNGEEQGDQPNQKSSRWGNASPKPSMSDDNCDNEPVKKQPRKPNNRNRNDKDNNDANNVENSNENQADSMTDGDTGVADAADTQKDNEFLNDPSNSDIVPVRPIRLQKEQIPTDSQTSEINTNDTHDTPHHANSSTSDFSNSNANRTESNDNAGDTNSIFQNADPPKPSRRPIETNTTPLYDEPQDENRKSHQNSQQSQSTTVTDSVANSNDVSNTAPTEKNVPAISTESSTTGPTDPPPSTSINENSGAVNESVTAVE